MNKIILFPIIVIIAGIVIAGGIFFSRQEINPENYESEVAENPGPEIKPVTLDDHILGDPNAEVLIIEYSDFECPFCQEFHVTMNRIMEEFGRSGRVAWVYRHFPLEEFHNQAKGASIASECVGDISGEGKFWEYTNLVFAGAPESLSPDNLKNIAIEIGSDEEKYTECIASGKFNDKIEQDIEDGLKIYDFDSNFGTPYNIIITKTGFKTEIVGAQPYTLIKEIIEQNSLGF